MQSNEFTIVVPATSANLGAGLDCIGTPLTLHDVYTFSESDKNTIEYIVAENAPIYPGDVDFSIEENLFFKAFQLSKQYMKIKPEYLNVIVKQSIPICRGLGSSAAAIAAGILAAYKYCDEEFSNSMLLSIAMQLENHPDNLAPIFYKSAVAISVQEPLCIQIKQSLEAHIFITNQQFSTSLARSLLTPSLNLQDSIAQLRSVISIIGSLEGRLPLCPEGFADKLHQPGRLPQISHYIAVCNALNGYECGTSGVLLSGSGSTLLVIIDKSNLKVKDNYPILINRFQSIPDVVHSILTFDSPKN